MPTLESLQQQGQRKLDPGNASPVIAAGESFVSVSEQISNIVLTRKTPLFWWSTFAVGLALLGCFVVAIYYLLFVGVGMFGIQNPIAWGFAITNFVWWI